MADETPKDIPMIPKPGGDFGKLLRCKTTYKMGDLRSYTETVSFGFAQINIIFEKEHNLPNYRGGTVEVEGQNIGHGLFGLYAQIPFDKPVPAEGLPEKHDDETKARWLDDLVEKELVERTETGFRRVHDKPECVVMYHKRPMHAHYRIGDSGKKIIDLTRYGI